jgi:hypothetical protein
MTNEATSISEATIQREALKAFAALTRHEPHKLASTFRCHMTWEVAEDMYYLVLSFGKRHHVAYFAPDLLQRSLDDFVAQVLRPAAKLLLASA